MLHRELERSFRGGQLPAPALSDESVVPHDRVAPLDAIRLVRVPIRLDTVRVPDVDRVHRVELAPAHGHFHPDGMLRYPSVDP